MLAKNPIVAFSRRFSLVSQIAMGLVLGVIIGTVTPSFAPTVGILGSLFVGALKAVAPFLVFILVTAAIAQHKEGTQTNIRPILFLYVLGTFGAAVIAVLGSFLFPTSLTLVAAAETSSAPPTGIAEVIKNVLMNLVSNPISALASGNYIGILAWGLVLGIALRDANEVTHTVIADLTNAVSMIVRGVIRSLDFGIARLHGLGGICIQSIDCVLENQTKSVSFGDDVFARKWHSCIFHTFVCGEYSCEHGVGEKTEFT